MNGITIVGRDKVTGSDGRIKEITTFSVDTAARIDEILTIYPNTDEGSFAICFPTGTFKTLLDGIWI